MPRVRVHQHVNPLAPFYRQAPDAVDLSAVFAKPDQPLHLDIGCARGRFILQMAEVEPRWNFLGVEIREPLVAEANRIAVEQGLANLHYAFCNAMLWLDRLLSDIPDGVLKMVTIHFPDPWFKKKHAKRRMVNAELIDAIARKLSTEGRIFVQTDIEPLAEEIFELFRERKDLKEFRPPRDLFQVKTERGRAVENREMPIYSTMFEKK